MNDIRPFLLEERIPDGWEPRVMSRFGLTFLTFNKTVLRVERGIHEDEGGAAATSAGPAAPAGPATQAVEV